MVTTSPAPAHDPAAHRPARWLSALPIVGVVLWSGLATAALPEVVVLDRPDVPERTPENLSAAKAAVEATHKAFADKALADAAAHARRAWELRPNASTARFYATILNANEQPCDAFQFLLLARDLDATATEAAKIDGDLERTGPRCGSGYGWVELSATPADATVQVSGRTVPARRTIGVIAGAHDVVVRADGYKTRLESIRVRSGAGARLSIMLVRGEDPPDLVLPGSNDDWRRPTGIALSVVGGASLATGIVLMAVAGKRRDDAADAATPTNNPADDAARRSEYDSAVSDMETLWPAGLALGLIGAGAVAGGVAILLTGDEPSAAPSASLQVDEHGAQVLLQGRF